MSAIFYHCLNCIWQDITNDLIKVCPDCGGEVAIDYRGDFDELEDG